MINILLKQLAHLIGYKVTCCLHAGPLIWTYIPSLSFQSSGVTCA